MLLNGIKIIRGSGLPIRGQQKQATKKILKIMVRRIKHTAEPFTHFFNPVHDCISMYMQFLGRQSQALSVFQIDKQCFYIVGLIVYICLLYTSIPQAVAQDTASHLINLGVKGFWNFTNIELSSQLPDVQFENIHFADSLLTLSYRIANR